MESGRQIPLRVVGREVGGVVRALEDTDCEEKIWYVKMWVEERVQ
jgi:hypothetical protein